MKMKVVAAVVGALGVVNVYAGDTYNVESGFSHQSVKVDDKTDYKFTGIGATYYLKSVTIDPSQPFDELAFLQKASGISVSYANVSLETANLKEESFGSTKIGGNFYIDNFSLALSSSKWNQRFPFKANAANSIGIDTKDTAFKAGYFITPNTEISYVNEKSESDYSPSAGVGAVNSSTVKASGIQSHTVMSLGSSQWLTFDLSYKEINTKQDRDDTNKLYSASAKYYPKTNLYFELGYSKNSGDLKYDEGSTTTLGFGYSVTPRLMLALSHAKFSGDVSAENSSAKFNTVKAQYRF